MHICVVTTNVALQAALPWLLPNTEFAFVDPDGGMVESCDAVVVDLGTTDSALSWLTGSTSGLAPGTPTIVVGDAEPSGAIPAHAEIVLRPVDLEDLRTRLERHRPADERGPDPELDTPSGLGKWWRRVGRGGRITPEPVPTPDRSPVDVSEEPPRPKDEVPEGAPVSRDRSDLRETQLRPDGGDHPEVVTDDAGVLEEEIAFHDASSREARRAGPSDLAAEPTTPSREDAARAPKDASTATADDGETDRARTTGEPEAEPSVGAEPVAEVGAASSRSIPRPPADAALEPETTPVAPPEPDVGDVEEHGPHDVQPSSEPHTEPSSTTVPAADQPVVGEQPVEPATADAVAEAAGPGRQPPSDVPAPARERAEEAPAAPLDREAGGSDGRAPARSSAHSAPVPAGGVPAHRGTADTRVSTAARLIQWCRRGLRRFRGAVETLRQRVTPDVRQLEPRGTAPRLADQIDQLPALADPAAVASALAAELHDRGAADAVAVLLRSHDGYRAIGGARLTSAQQRASIPLDHPLAELLATRPGGMLLLEGQHGGTALVRGVPVAHEDVTTVIPLHDDEGLLAITVIGGLGGRPPALIGAVEEAREFLQLLTWLEAEDRD